MVANVGLSETDLPYIFIWGSSNTLHHAILVSYPTDTENPGVHHNCYYLCYSVITLTNLLSASLIALQPRHFYDICLWSVYPSNGNYKLSILFRGSSSFNSFNTAAQQISMSIASLTSSYIIGFTSEGAH